MIEKAYKYLTSKIPQLLSLKDENGEKGRKVIMWLRNGCDFLLEKLKPFCFVCFMMCQQVSFSHAKHYQERTWEWPYPIFCKRRVARWRGHQMYPITHD